MKLKMRTMFIFFMVFLSINALQVGAISMYREKITYPDGWFEEMSVPYREMKFSPFYLDESQHEIEVGDYEIDKARKWGYKTIDEYDAEDIVTLYATEKTIKIPKFLKDTYLNVGWVESLITLYAPDGRTLKVTPHDKQTYINLGWFDRPVSTLYTLDGRKKIFYNDEVEAQCNVGWYREKPVRLYTLDGREKLFLPSQVEAQCSVGWYKTAPVTLYTRDGRSKVFAPDEVDAQRSVGWYYKSELDKINELVNMAKTFYVGQKVWLNRIAAYNPVGYIVSKNDTEVVVNWKHFYDYNWYRVYSQNDIQIAEIVTGITLGNNYTYSADKISAYK